MSSRNWGKEYRWCLLVMAVLSAGLAVYLGLDRRAGLVARRGAIGSPKGTAVQEANTNMPSSQGKGASSNDRCPAAAPSTSHFGEVIVKVLRESDSSAVVGMPVGLKYRGGATWRDYRTGIDGTVVVPDVPEGRASAATATGAFTNVDVVSGESNTAVILVPSGKTIHGLVVTQEGTPSPSAEVWIWRDWNEENAHRVTNADQAGRFEVQDIPIGYRVSARSLGYGPSHGLDIGDQILDRKELVLVLGLRVSTVSGVVTDGTGTGVPGAFVFVGRLPGRGRWVGDDKRTWTSTVTDEDGNFALPASSSSAESILWVKYAGFATHRRSISATEASEALVIQLEEEAGLAGTVVDRQGSAVSGATVQLTGNGWKDLVEFDGPSWANLQATSDERGLFRVSNVPTGAWEAVVISGIATAKQQVQTTAGIETMCQFELKGESNVAQIGRQWSGRVVDQAGFGVDSMRVVISPTDGCAIRNSKTDTAGWFQIVDCCPLTSSVSVYDEILGWSQDVYQDHQVQADTTLEFRLAYVRPYSIVIGHVVGHRPGDVAKLTINYESLVRELEMPLTAHGEFSSGKTIPGLCTIVIRVPGSEAVELVGKRLVPGETTDCGVIELPSRREVGALAVSFAGLQAPAIVSVLGISGHIVGLSTTAGDLVRITDIPEGDYTVSVWSDKVPLTSSSVSVRANLEAELALTIGVGVGVQLSMAGVAREGGRFRFTWMDGIGRIRWVEEYRYWSPFELHSRRVILSPGDYTVIVEEMERGRSIHNLSVRSQDEGVVVTIPRPGG